MKNRRDESMEKTLVAIGLCVIAFSGSTLSASVSHAGVTERASVDSNGTQANGESGGCAQCEFTISDNGRHVAFVSRATNMIASDANGSLGDVFVKDRQTGATVLVSKSSGGAQGNNGSMNPSISSDGRYVAFVSVATNLVPNDANGNGDVFVHDRDPDGNGIFDEGNGLTTLVSVSSGGAQPNGNSVVPSISADGRHVAFMSAANNVVENDSNFGGADVFVHDRQTGTTVLVSRASSGVQGNGENYLGLGVGPSHRAISSDGRYVVFSSTSTNLVPDDINSADDVFVHDRDPDGNGVFDEGNGVTTRVSVSSQGVPGTHPSSWATISADGRHVAFMSRAQTLVPNDTNGTALDIFVHDRLAGTTVMVSVDSAGSQGPYESFGPASINTDGRFIAFGSPNTLVADDTNSAADVFVYDRDPDKDGIFDEGNGITTRESVDSNGVQGNGNSFYPVIGSTGQYAAFGSDASNLVLGDTNAVGDVFVKDRGLTPPVPPGPPRPQVAYVTNTGSNTVSAVDIFLNPPRVFATIPVGFPLDIDTSDTGTFAYVNTGLGSVVRIDISSNPPRNRVVRNIPIGSLTRDGWNTVDVVIAPGKNRAYVTNYGSNTISVIDTFTDTVIATVPVSNPWAATVLPDASRVYVGNVFDSNTVTVIDTANNQVRTVIPVGVSPGMVMTNPDGSRVWVGNYYSNSISVIDTATDSVICTVANIPSPLDFRFSSDGARVYVNASGDNTIRVLNPGTCGGSIVPPIIVGPGLRGIELSPDNSKLYVVVAGSDAVSVIDTVSLQVVGTFPVGSSPLDIEIRSRTFSNPPVADPQSVTTPEDTPKAIVLTASDPDGDRLTFTVNSGPSHGTLSGTAPNVTYTPSLNYYGPDSFTFTASDGLRTSDPVLVSINVTAVNDPPVANAGPDQVVEATSPAGAEVILDGTGSYDPDPDTITLTWTGCFGSTTGPRPTVTVPLSPSPCDITLTVSDGSLQGTDGVQVAVRDSTPPTPPTNLRASPVSPSQIDLRWDPSTDAVGVTRYRVERCTGATCGDFVELPTPPITGTAYSDVGLSPGTTYIYRVRAQDAVPNLSPYSNTASATTFALQDRLPTSDRNVAGRWNGVGCESGGGGTGGSLYPCVDDPIGSPNDSTDYIQIRNRSGKEAIFGFSPFTIPSGATIQFVRVTYVAIANGGSADIKAALRVNSTIYTQPTSQSLSSAWATYSYDWVVNPRTGTAWTVADVNGSALQGMGVYSGNGDESVTQIYVTVGYQPPQPPPPPSNIGVK